MGSRVPLCMIALLLGHVALDAVPASEMSEMVKAISESVVYDPVIDFTTDIITLGIESEGNLTIQVVTVHQGQKMITPPRSVELLMTRELPDGVPDDIRTICEEQVELLGDGESFERLGNHNVRHVDRQNTVAVAIVFPADTFSRLAHALSVQGRACGADFSLNSEHLVGLQSFVERWPPRQ